MVKSFDMQKFIIIYCVAWCPISCCTVIHNCHPHCVNSGVSWQTTIWMLSAFLSLSVQTKFPQISKAKIKEGIFIGSQISEFMRTSAFDTAPNNSTTFLGSH